MKLYANQSNTRLFYYVIFFGLLLTVAIPLYMGKDLTHVLISNIFLYIVLGLGVYTSVVSYTV